MKVVRAPAGTRREPSPSLAVYSLIPAEAVHYSTGQWVEDDAAGDGAFSCAGAFGFYPWISHGETTWGILARFAPAFGRAQAGVALLMRGREIRAAWTRGQAR